jgi:hypothetical protein
MYKPNEPGIYSCILEINDRANNSEYVRRIVIYDNSSMVKTSETKALYVSTASPDTNFMWQTTFSEEGLTQVNVSWQGHLSLVKVILFSNLTSLVQFSVRLYVHW